MPIYLATLVLLVTKPTRKNISHQLREFGFLQLRSLRRSQLSQADLCPVILFVHQHLCSHTNVYVYVYLYLLCATYTLSATIPMAVKRKRSEYEAEAKNHDESDSGASLSQKMAESDSDIADALIGVDDEDDGDLIRKTLAKKNMKQGTQMINKSKQKQKGDVGGGSFQSMGSNNFFFGCHEQTF